MDPEHCYSKNERGLLRENISDDSKERMMMKKIWGLLIILCCSLVSVAFAQETNFNLVVPDSSTLVNTDVNVSIEKNGILTFQADNPLLQGEVSMKVTEKLTLLSGDYAGWGYALIEYNAGKLKGSLYYVFHNDEARGMLTGDIIGVAQQGAGLEEDMTWRVATLNGTETQVTINLTFNNYKPGKTSEHYNIWMPVLPSFTLSANGYSQETTLLLLPAPDGNPHNARKFKGGGLEFGTYQSGAQGGTFWSFLDNTETVDPPFIQKRYGTRDGILSGTAEISFQNNAGANSAVNQSILLAEPY